MYCSKEASKTKGTVSTVSLIRIHPASDDYLLSIICFGGKCVAPAFAMPHRGMASLASVGLDGKTVALGLLSVSQHTSRFHSSRKGKGLSRGTLEGRAGKDLQSRERGLGGERGNSRREFPSGDETQALSLFFGNCLRRERRSPEA